MVEAYLPQVWLKAFWGFDPSNDGYLGFTLPGNRDRLIREYLPGDLVLIYGADNEETRKEDRRQALGFLEIEPSPIADVDRMSTQGKQRKIDNGWQERWTYAVPVRRAWRVNRRIEIKHIAPTTYRKERARVIASQGELLSPEEAKAALQLPVSAVNVYGEPAIVEASKAEYALSSLFTPSRGIEPTFGRREYDVEDGPHWLYMLRLVGDVSALLDREPSDLAFKIIVKVGYSKEPKRRRDEHNSSLPPAGKLRWKLDLTSKAFRDGASAKQAEDKLKETLATRFESLGGEFFLGSKEQICSAFIDVASETAFRIVAVTKRSTSAS